MVDLVSSWSIVTNHELEYGARVRVRRGYIGEEERKE